MEISRGGGGGGRDDPGRMTPAQRLLSALPNPNSRFQPQQLDNLRFSDFFVWLSRSVSAISRSTPGDTVNLPPADWATINV